MRANESHKAETWAVEVLFIFFFFQFSLNHQTFSLTSQKTMKASPSRLKAILQGPFSVANGPELPSGFFHFLNINSNIFTEICSSVQITSHPFICYATISVDGRVSFYVITEDVLPRVNFSKTCFNIESKQPLIKK